MIRQLLTERLTNQTVAAIERGWVPNTITRQAIRHLCKKRLQSLQSDSINPSSQNLEFSELMRIGPIAPVPDQANSQHYEVPSSFFRQVLGPRMKYSCCYFENESTSLADAEDASLRQSCDHAELVDGMNILELGCGWGSLTLWMALHFPTARITAVSNSNSQREFIAGRAKELGVADRVSVVTCDVNLFDPLAASFANSMSGTRQAGRFDRVVSIEMFEHMRNYELLLQRVSDWLTPEGKLFVHIFCHRDFAYEFQDTGATNWMGRHFFTGGIMPSANLFEQFQDHMIQQNRWCWNGTHYQRTSERWLENMKLNKSQILADFELVYGQSSAVQWYHRWRLFFMACCELFAYNSGNEWFVNHYLFSKTS